MTDGILLYSNVKWIYRRIKTYFASWSCHRPLRFYSNLNEVFRFFTPIFTKIQPIKPCHYVSFIYVVITGISKSKLHKNNKSPISGRNNGHQVKSKIGRTIGVQPYYPFYVIKTLFRNEPRERGRDRDRKNRNPHIPYLYALTKFMRRKFWKTEKVFLVSDRNWSNTHTPKIQ